MRVYQDLQGKFRLAAQLSGSAQLFDQPLPDSLKAAVPGSRLSENPQRSQDVLDMFFA
jgi:hypothetical protein